MTTKADLVLSNSFPFSTTSPDQKWTNPVSFTGRFRPVDSEGNPLPIGLIPLDVLIDPPTQVNHSSCLLILESGYTHCNGSLTLEDASLEDITNKQICTWNTPVCEILCNIAGGCTRNASFIQIQNP